MARLLGIDTGGTYTDAIILNDQSNTIIAKAKSLTTRPDLHLGIGRAIDAVLAESGAPATSIAMVSLSTTLATNALVEGQGARVALIMIGFDAREQTRAGLAEAAKDTPLISLPGGHTHAGTEVAPLDVDGLSAALAALPEGIQAVAIAAQFATRNPAHEIAARAAVHRVLGVPTTCSHELSAKLNGPKRALTALLNARLVSLIDRLISACETHLAARGIHAPLMVVRGDGALISAAQVRERPIETILSGPAASVAGAAWLTGLDHAMVSDIGGTTTDVCLLQNGRPSIDPEGAMVGGHRTMVEAVAMRTFGLGGDSETHVAAGLAGGLTLGPRRVMPLSLAATQWPDLVHTMIDAALANEPAMDERWRLIVPLTHSVPQGLGARETTLLTRMAGQPTRVDRLILSRVEYPALERLIALGLVIPTGVTPTDAAHVLGLQATFDSALATKALTLFARKRAGHGNKLATDAADMARQIIDALTRQSVACLMETAFAEDPFPWADQPASLAVHPLTQRALQRLPGLIDLRAHLGVPVVGLGASAECYYPAIAAHLGTQAHIPAHAGVANAVGAVVGQVSMREEGHITCPGPGLFVAHSVAGPQRFSGAEDAVQALSQALSEAAHARAQAAGVDAPRLSVERDDVTAEVEGQAMIIEIKLSVTATGRPRIAIG